MKIKPVPAIAIAIAISWLVFALLVSKSAIAVTPSLDIALNPSQGANIGLTYEAFLSPLQEPDEEENTPRLAPQEFRSTAPSTPRSQRTSRGHGIVRFTNDLSMAYVDIQAENVNPEDIVLFHIHCGRPGVLGPILADFTLSGNLPEDFADGRFSAVLTNSDLEAVVNAGEGLVGAFTAGCPIGQGIPDKVKTIAGMQYIAEQGDLYFNLHTTAHTFYGEMRGQLRPVR